MRTQILLARKHDVKTFELLCGPEVPITRQESILREYRIAGIAHESIAEIQRWEPDQGTLVTVKFQKPDDVAKATAKVKSDYETHKELLANPAKAEKLRKAAAEKTRKELAEKNKKAHDEATAKAAANKKLQDEQDEKNIAQHNQATILMAERRANADNKAAVKSAQETEVVDEKLSEVLTESNEVKSDEVTVETPVTQNQDL